MSVTFTTSDSRVTRDGFEGRQYPVTILVKGFDSTNEDDHIYGINFCNANAAAVLRAMGFEGDSCFCGSELIAEFRQRLMRASNRNLSPYTREGFQEFGKPRSNGDGTIEMRPLRVVSMGIDEDGLNARLTRLAAYVEQAQSQGATHVSWG